MIFSDGYIPDEIQAQEARKVGGVSDREKVLAQAKPFDDASQTPPVWDWKDFISSLNSPYEEVLWWEKSDARQLFTASQETLPNCAGFAMANAALVRTLIQKDLEFSEQSPVKFNPLGTWQASKKGSLRGGQTISAIADAGREIGNCLASDLGDYSDRQSFRTLDETTRQNASRHQIGISLYDGPRDAIPELLMTLCRHGITAIVGNCVAVKDGRTRDSNGVEVVSISNQGWAHATAFGGFKTVNGTDYVFWLNSHGEIYPASDGSPAFGGWMDLKTLKQFVQGQFFDLCAVTYCEANFNSNIKPTLNPWR